MFNALYPGIYRQLRQRTGLTQADLGKVLKLSRHTMNKVESGRAQLDASQERQLFEMARCSREDFCELLCQQLSELIDHRVGIQTEHRAYEPSTALATAYELLREHQGNLSAAMRRALHNRINTTQLLNLAFDRNNADLVELTLDCREQLKCFENR